MSLTLYHNDMSVCSAKVRMALAEKELAWEGIHLDLRAGDAQKPEYVKLNPNQVVPTLLHDGAIVIESNVICEYLDDAFPDQPLRPADPLARARMRLWTKQLDEGLHAATATVSTCIAFRHQHLARKPEDLKAWLDNMVDPARRDRTRLAIELGTESPDFGHAVTRFERLLDEMDRALTAGAWLAGDTYSLADLAYAPYLKRLQHLGFGDRVTARPRTSEWAQRLLTRPAFQRGVGQWLNSKYLALFEAHRDSARRDIARIVGV
jgi:glutathione S-transferase